MRTLRTRILLLATVLVVLSVLGTVLSVLGAVRNDIEERASDNLKTAVVGMNRMILTRRAMTAASISNLVADANFRGAVWAQDANPVRDMLLQSSAAARAGVAMVINQDGIPWIATDNVPVTLGQRDFSETSQDRGRLWEFSGTVWDMRVHSLGSILEGHALAMGFAVDDKLARELGEFADLDVGFMRGDRLVGISMPQHTARQTNPHSNPNNYQLLPVDDEVKQVTTGKTEYLSASSAYPGVSGNELSVGVARSVDVAMAPYYTVRMAVPILAGFAMTIALVGAFVLSRTVTQPVSDLLQAVRRIRMGDYTDTVDVNSKDEIGELASAIKSMQQGIAKREDHIRHQANFDPLTELPNRRLALRQLDSLLAAAQQRDQCVAVALLTLNRVDDIASSLGHGTADEVLRVAAQRLRGRLTEENVVARLDGSEFLLGLADQDGATARSSIQRLLAMLRKGFSVGDANISLDARAGIASFPEHGRKAEDLMLRAAVARSDAREAQGGCHIYHDGSEERYVKRLAILGDLRRAVDEDQLELYVQPKLSLADNSVCGAEALVRWRHPDLGWIPPGDFIGVAEQAGSIGLVTQWVLRRALRACRDWEQRGVSVDMSINLSALDLKDGNLGLRLRDLLRTSGLDSHRLTLEITEQALVEDVTRARELLDQLGASGVRIAIDDFGTGYSSLEQLRNLPVNEIKIDRTFVVDLPRDRRSAAIVRAAADLAHNLNLSVVAEGVESEAALKWLRRLGCEEAQGFHISQPMPVAAFPDWLARRERKQSRLTEQTGSFRRPRLVS